jgi:hypothetical protein
MARLPLVSSKSASGVKEYNDVHGERGSSLVMMDRCVFFPVMLSPSISANQGSIRPVTGIARPSLVNRSVRWLVLGLIVMGSVGPVAAAETCRKQMVNGQGVTICCDGNGVCYRK